MNNHNPDGAPGKASSTSFEEALSLAKNAVKVGDARQYMVDRDPAIGRYIDLESSQGWPPGHFWQEFED